MLIGNIHAFTRRRQWRPTPVLLPGKSHGKRSLVGCSPWGCWVGHDWVTSLSLFTFMLWRRKWQPTPVFLPGESQGWGAWWAAVYGVTQSQTRLKWFSSRHSLGAFTRETVWWGRGIRISVKESTGLGIPGHRLSLHRCCFYRSAHCVYFSTCVIFLESSYKLDYFSDNGI